VPEALLAIEVAIFLVGFSRVYVRDKFVGVFFLFLFIYCIFAQVGYFYFSELSEFIGAYFGERSWYKATAFIVLSFISFLFFFFFCYNPILHLIPFSISIKRGRLGGLGARTALLVLVLALVYQVLYLIDNSETINWLTAQDEEATGQNIPFRVFIFLFKLLVGINLALYVLVRLRSGLISPRWLRLFFVASLGVFFVVAFRLGNRTDILAFGLGVALFELYKAKATLRTYVVGVFGSFVLVAFMIAIETFRADVVQDATGILPAIIGQDYYAPAHILFAAVAFDVIDPIEVMRSNFANALILMNVPYLQTGVTELFNPGVATRSAGYAFLVLAEGYIFAGLWGAVYNGAVLNLWLALWRKVAMSNSRDFNLLALAIMGAMLVNLVRGQTSFFIKYFYMFVFPSALFYLALRGQSAKLRLSRSHPSELIGENLTAT
jgi:hypothetical protein